LLLLPFKVVCPEKTTVNNEHFTLILSSLMPPFQAALMHLFQARVAKARQAERREKRVLFPAKAPMEEREFLLLSPAKDRVAERREHRLPARERKWLLAREPKWVPARDPMVARRASRILARDLRCLRARDPMVERDVSFIPIPSSRQ
jgi:hypothetical protein